MKRISLLIAILSFVALLDAQESPANLDSLAVGETQPAVSVDSLGWPGFPRVSLLTCTPGTEIWEQYGHTAIRYEDPAEQIDAVFNYGLFSFSAPHFVWRFCTGQTDYIVGAEEYPYFEVEYLMRGSAVKVQVLDMTPEEVARFRELISLNLQKENRTYRYNFFYKNCSTMARDILYQSLATQPTLAPCDSVTLRSILHAHNEAYPWASFAIDLVLGTEADRPVAHDLQEFAPDKLHTTFAQAQRAGQPFVKEESTIGPEVALPDIFRFPLTPVQAMYILLLLTAIVCVFELLVEKAQWGYDIVLYGLQGVMGLVIAFLFFCSGHPAVDSNVLVILFNPLIFVLLPFIMHSRRRKKCLWACWAEIGLIAVLCIVQLIVRQQVPTALWILTASLTLRTVHHFGLYRYLSFPRQAATKHSPSRRR